MKLNTEKVVTTHHHPMTSRQLMPPIRDARDDTMLVLICKTTLTAAASTFMSLLKIVRSPGVSRQPFPMTLKQHGLHWPREQPPMNRRFLLRIGNKRRWWEEHIIKRRVARPPTSSIGHSHSLVTRHSSWF